MSTDTATLGDAPDYENKVPLHAFKGMRGNRIVYTIRPTIGIALDLMPKPDPNVPFPNNRPLVVPHSKEWGDYWEKNPSAWGCPAGLVSVREDFPQLDFLVGGTGNGYTVGMLKLPRDMANISEILDMQHRIYGWHLKRAELSERLRKGQDELMQVRSLDDPLLLAPAEAKVRRLKETLARLHQETITVEIMVMTEDEHRTLFAKIADKALAINKSQIADYDSTQVINRVARALSDNHPLLTGRVDWVRTNVSDTVRKSNPNLVSGETLVNLVRPFATGNIVGRVTEARNVELEAEESKLYSSLSEFLDVLPAAFELLGGVLADTTRPSEVRTQSLLGSRTMLRVLATAYHRLTTGRVGRKAVKPVMSRDEVLAYLKTLAPHMALPLDRNSIWFTTGAFPSMPEDEDADLPRAPLSRQQDLKALTDAIVLWATTGVPEPAE